MLTKLNYDRSNCKQNEVNLSRLILDGADVDGLVTVWCSQSAPMAQIGVVRLKCWSRAGAIWPKAFMRQLSRWPMSDEPASELPHDGSCGEMTLGVENVVYAGMDGEETLG